MKRIVALLMVLCLLLVGCAKTQNEVAIEEEIAIQEEIVIEEETVEEEIVEEEAPAVGRIILPLPDTTMDDLNDAIFHISLEKGDAYVDDEGILQMDVTVYSYDKYDLVDVSMLEVGDTIVRWSGEVEVISKEQNDAGMISINGGLEEGGFDLVTDDDGVYYEIGFDDAKNWYEVGTATLRVSADMVGIDNADLELGEVIFYPGDLLTDAIENFHFTPHNTTIRTEGGQVVELERRYVP